MFPFIFARLPACTVPDFFPRGGCVIPLGRVLHTPSGTPGFLLVGVLGVFLVWVGCVGEGGVRGAGEKLDFSVLAFEYAPVVFWVAVVCQADYLGGAAGVGEVGMEWFVPVAVYEKAGGGCLHECEEFFAVLCAALQFSCRQRELYAL